MRKSSQKEVLEMLGDCAAGELTREDTCEAERYILENPKGRDLVDSYLRLLELLSNVGLESAGPPRAMAEHAIRLAAAEILSKEDREEARKE